MSPHKRHQLRAARVWRLNRSADETSVFFFVKSESAQAAAFAFCNLVSTDARKPSVTISFGLVSTLWKLIAEEVNISSILTLVSATDEQHFCSSERGLYHSTQFDTNSLSGSHFQRVSTRDLYYLGSSSQTTLRQKQRTRRHRNAIRGLQTTSGSDS